MNSGIDPKSLPPFTYVEPDYYQKSVPGSYLDYSGQQPGNYEYRSYEGSPSYNYQSDINQQYSPYSRAQDIGYAQTWDKDPYSSNQAQEFRYAGQEISNKSQKRESYQKPAYEENYMKGEYKENREYEDRTEPKSITETIDANKVKTSKLFQKFLQNENKENPNRPSNQQKNATNRSVSPAGRAGKDANKNKSMTPKQAQQKVRQLQPQHSPKAHEDDYDNYPQPRERGTKKYEEERDYDGPERSPREENAEYNHNYYGQPEGRNAEIDLNQQSSSKLVSMQNQGQEAYPSAFPGFQGQAQNPNGFYPMPHPYFMGFGMNPEMMGQQQPNYQNMNSATEVFMLRAQVMELNQALTREIEANKTLDNRCTEYLNQLEKSAHNFEEFKEKISDQGSGHQEEVRRLQDKIRHLNDTLVEKERAEEQLTTDLNKLRKKLDAELESRGRLLEEHDDLERRKFEELDSLKKELEQKDEELSRLRRENDSNRHDKDGLKQSEDRFMREIRGLKSENTELNRINEDLRKNLDDKTQQLNFGKMESNSLRGQLDTMDSQYRDLLSENDRVKRESFNMKERLLAAENEIKNLQLALDKTQMNADQTSEALSRTEKALERERRITADLRNQLATGEQPRVNQWENSRRTYSSQNSQFEERPFDQGRDQYQSRIENSPQNKTRDQQFQPTKYELRREAAKSSRPQETVEPRDQQRSYQQEPRNQEPRDQYSQGQSRNQYGYNQGSRGQTVRNEDESYQRSTQQQQQQQQYSRENNNQEDRNRGGFRKQPSQEENQGNLNRNQYSSQGNRRGNQEEFTPSIPKLTAQNQVYKPTNNLLVWDESPVDKTPTNNRRGANNERQPEPRQEEIPDRTTGGKRQQRVPEPQENFLAWDESPKPGNRKQREVVERQERQEDNYNRRKPQPQEVDDRSRVNTVNKKPNQNANSGAPEMVFGKEENKTPQDLREVKNFENELMSLQMQRDNLHNELQRLDKVKIKSGANIKRKQEVESELNMVNSNISNVKTRLRELNALHPF